MVLFTRSLADERRGGHHVTSSQLVVFLPLLLVLVCLVAYAKAHCRAAAHQDETQTDADDLPDGDDGARLLDLRRGAMAERPARGAPQTN